MRSVSVSVLLVATFFVGAPAVAQREPPILRPFMDDTVPGKPEPRVVVRDRGPIQPYKPPSEGEALLTKLKAEEANVRAEKMGFEPPAAAWETWNEWLTPWFDEAIWKVREKLEGLEDEKAEELYDIHKTDFYRDPVNFIEIWKKLVPIWSSGYLDENSNPCATSFGGINPARAARPARCKGVSASYIHVEEFQAAEGTYDISTDELNPGGDTVLHVIDGDSGKVVAYSDDCKHLVPASCVRIVSPGSRKYTVLVRQQHTRLAGLLPNYVGTAKLTIQRVGSSYPMVSKDIKYSTGHYFGTTPKIVEFQTVEEQGGAADTVMLYVTGGGRLWAYDDNTGTGVMSALETWERCPNIPFIMSPFGSPPCAVIVGSRNPDAIADPNRRLTTVVMQDSPHIPGNDHDGDGLSNWLEDVLGTRKDIEDTDRDGIEDDVEVFGIDTTGVGSDYAQKNLLNFPYYGADPNWPDIFIQTDWDSHTSLASYDLTLKYDRIMRIAAIYDGIAAIHIDNGIVNNEPETQLLFGRWGGAELRSWDTYFLPSTAAGHPRSGYFHFALLSATRPTSMSQTPGMRLMIANDPPYDPAVFAHELAHNLGLRHHGMPGKPPLNCKPNYPSLMNYAYMSLPEFSRGLLATLDRTALEEDGIKTKAGQKLSYPELHRLVGPDSTFEFYLTLGGWIDWNRNDEFSANRVKAMANSSQNMFCGGGMEYATKPEWTTQDMGSALTRVGTTLFWFARNMPAGQNIIRYRHTDFSGLALPAACEAGIGARCDTAWSNWSDVPGSRDAAYDPAAIGISGPTDSLLLVYAVGSDPYFQIATRQGTSSSFSLQWSPLTLVRRDTSVSPMKVEGTPALVKTGPNSIALFWLSVNKELYKWTFSISNNSWSDPEQQYYLPDGAPAAEALIAGYGIAPTLGYLWESPDGSAHSPRQRLVAAIPRPVPLNPGLYYTQIAATDPDATSGVWTPLLSAAQAFTSARPGFAYVHSGPGQEQTGRYYLALRHSGYSPPAFLIANTRGNVVSLSGANRFHWNRFVGLSNATAESGVSLFSDFIGPYGVPGLMAVTNVSYHDGLNKYIASAFLPFADGITDTPMEDHDDISYLRANIGCCMRDNATKCACN